MRNPNGFGSVYKASGNRRKPYIARVTIGWDDSGKQLYRQVGSYETRQKALIALADYNKNPYSVEASTITFAELYEKLAQEKFEKISRSNVNGYTAAYKRCSKIHDVKVVEIRKTHLQSIIDEIEIGWATKKKCKILFNQMFKLALENDIITKDYSQFVTIGSNDSDSNRAPFTDMEIQSLFDNVHKMAWIDTVLIMIYSGLRIGELIIIKTSDVDLEQRTIRGGIKTAAGKNRIIPIHSKIYEFIVNRYNPNNEFLLINDLGKQLKYSNYKREKWEKIMEALDMKHEPHDCRHTFATLMDNAGANKVAIKRIMGHASSDITDRVYTHKDLEELRKAIDLI